MTGVWIKNVRRRIRNVVGGLSIKRKLMLSYAVMMVVPIVIVMGFVVVAHESVERLNPVSQRAWIQLLPSQINGVFVNQSASMIYKELHRDDVELQDIRFYIAILEWEGLDVVLARDGRLQYMTPSENAQSIWKSYQAGTRESLSQEGMVASMQSNAGALPGFRERGPFESQVRPASLEEARFFRDDRRRRNNLQWDDDELQYTIIVPSSGWEFYGRGHMLFLGKSIKEETLVKIAMEMTVGFGILLFFGVIWYVGVLMARGISRMIVRPVTELRDAAQAVANGQWSTPIHAVYQDEIGDMCNNFDSMRETLQKQAAAKKAYEEQKRLMLSGISHDLATPLTAISGFAEGLKMGLAKTPEQEARYLNRIAEQAQIMRGLVDSLREFSRLEGGSLPLSLQTLDMGDWLKQYIGEKAATYKERGLFMSLIVENRPLTVSVDTYQWTRVVTNILENALKYARDDQGLVNLAISCSRQGKFIEIAFADQGPGVDDEDLHKLFDVFYRTDESRTNVANGSGLGLAIVKQIVVGMQGKVKAFNRTGGGLVISVKLPGIDPRKEK